jgi:hypothetical protein
MSFDGHEQTEASREQQPTVERRAAIRRGAALLAGVTGLGVAAAAAAPSASAAPGDPVVQGASNNAAATTTSLTSSAAGGTLALSNTGTGAALRVAASTIIPAEGTAGDHRSFNPGGFVFPTFTHVTGTDLNNPADTGLLFSDSWAFQPIPVVPQRALDTRSAAGRARVLDPAGKFDSAGRLLAGSTITLSLTDYVFGFGAVLGNLTVTGPLAGGFLVLYPADPRPPASSINYVTGQTIANFSFTGLDFTGADMVVRIFALSTTHVIFDITGFAVGSIRFLNQAILPAAAAQASRINRAAAPEWFHNQQARLGAGGSIR